VEYLPINEQITDVLTKPLARPEFVYFHDKLGVKENVPLDERGVDDCIFVRHSSSLLPRVVGWVDLCLLPIFSPMD
jgi:hypothetical protein